MNPFMLSLLGMVIRHILSAGGGFAVAKGYLDADTVTQIIGGLTVAGAGIWSGFQKLAAQRDT